MQLMWLSGPTAQVVSLSISRKTVVYAVAALVLALLLLGGALQLLGIRIAVEARPDLARTLGGVTSASEQDRIEHHYQARIAQLDAKLAALSTQVEQLETTKRAIVQLAQPPAPGTAKAGGQGGPFRRLFSFDAFSFRTVDGLTRMQDRIELLDQHVHGLSTTWAGELLRLRQLPLQPPLGGEYQQTSGFGTRYDPFNGALGRHEGIDFVAPYGSPILATADGVVAQAGRNSDYGLTVDIDHGQGFSTRYAHASKLEVQAGETVHAGQVIARLGNTGRSTGAHLHYEVRVNGQPIRPVADTVLRQASAQTSPGP